MRRSITLLCALLAMALASPVWAATYTQYLSVSFGSSYSSQASNVRVTVTDAGGTVRFNALNNPSGNAFAEDTDAAGTANTGTYSTTCTFDSSWSFPVKVKFTIVGQSGIVAQTSLNNDRAQAIADGFTSTVAGRIDAAITSRSTLTQTQVTGGAYALNTDGSGNVKVSSGTGAGQISLSSGLVSLSNAQTFNLTGNITGNLSGSVGSVTGAVGSVTGNVGGNVVGSVASVTGNVGGNVVGTVASVVGNVGGNVIGSVASIATGGIASTSFATGAITATAFAQGAADKVWSSSARSLTSAVTIDLTQALTGTGGWTGITLLDCFKSSWLYRSKQTYASGVFNMYAPDGSTVEKAFALSPAPSTATSRQ